jgi:hypothetical protein
MRSADEYFFCSLARTTSMITLRASRFNIAVSI